ncbi:uncharacterized protein CCOS01_00617 [Colletotrichum costaricense]|uniref:Uncharacterized protein n=1 Tax=Colletotrichum costaricense TaxID=1209916 RepID=A0AAI9Z9U5_9PEZI|nr:uncharacterized protein CCOS01_00617 [Colletotrichum costaricense]KAK1539303.1 hypothetical protein CCOS01_00617 [Colletotrichum costaricense]
MRAQCCVRTTGVSSPEASRTPRCDLTAPHCGAPFQRPFGSPHWPRPPSGPIRGKANLG